MCWPAAAAAAGRQVGSRAAYKVRGPEISPTLEDRELGKKPESPDPEERVRGRALPFPARQSSTPALTCRTPAALVGTRIRQDLEVSVGGGERENVIAGFTYRW